jgi:hypothetical protein
MYFYVGPFAFFSSQVCDFEMANSRHIRFIFPGLREYGWYRYNPLTSFDAVFKADVIYFNGGLHLLQLAPALVWYPANRHIWEEAEKRLEDFLDFAWNISPRLMMMLNHAVCEKDFTGGWKDVAEMLVTDPDQASRMCAESIVEEAESLCNEDPDRNCEPAAYATMLEECKQSTLTRQGSESLNTRLFETWRSWILKHDGDSKGAFGVNDAFNITVDKCDLSRDGRHYLTVVDAEIRNILNFAIASTSTQRN